MCKNEKQLTFGDPFGAPSGWYSVSCIHLQFVATKIRTGHTQMNRIIATVLNASG